MDARLSSLGRPLPRLGGRNLATAAASAGSMGALALGAPPRRLGPDRRPLAVIYFALKRNSVVVSYFWPGFNSAEGNDGLFGVSG